jgi:uncharacterized protein (DUF305 family)
MAPFSWKAGLAGIAIVAATAYALAQMHDHQGMPGFMGPMSSPEAGRGTPMQHGMIHHDRMMSMMHGGSYDGAHPDARKGDSGPSSLAFRGINQKMHEGMDIVFTGNADVDFVKGMIPHHQGAVDMAKTVLAFGKDVEVLKLAQDIITAQETEIAWMREWLKKNERQ